MVAFSEDARRFEKRPATKAPPDPMAFFRAAGAALALLTVAAIAHTSAREPVSTDYRLIDAAQDLRFPGIRTVMELARDATGLVWIGAGWAMLLALLALNRHWLPALATAVLPLGPATCLAVEAVLGRQPRPPAALLDRQVGPVEAVPFPSANVAATVLLFGLIFFLARRVSSAVGRLGSQAASAALVASAGFARVWLGTHWVTDVLAGYALGGLLLVLLLAAYRRIEMAVGDVPFIRAGPVPHDEGRPHAHALTSTILFRGATVAKIYNPGFVPRAIYWLAFQAPFAYERNPDALRAAVLRRNLAGLLTEHWYGSNRVARALGIERIDGRYALIGEFVEGTEPRDHHAARRFLFELADRFDEAGLPTWQIDPRQPRSLGNILERPEGTYVVIDLESGLVSPLASPRAWVRAIKRGLVPFYDDVYFDLTRAYVERETEAMRAARGDAWLAELRTTLGDAEAATAAWHASEPRIWSRLVRGLEAGFGVRSRAPAEAAQ